jgi:hypothetical protein
MSQQTPAMTILPLPGSSSFLQGFYGLEACAARGIVRLTVAGVVRRLTITLKCLRHCRYSETFQQLDSVDMNESLVNVSELLLVDTPLECGFIDLPFELWLPSHDSIGAGFGPCNELLPPSYAFSAGHGMADVKYLLESRLDYYPFNATVLTKLLLGPLITKVEISPFIVYDPRMMSAMLAQDRKRWQSVGHTIPVEYDITATGPTFGPGDQLNFSYKAVFLVISL